MNQILCILVLYNPNKALLFSAIDSIIGQIDRLWISDNSPQAILTEDTFRQYGEKVIYRQMAGNVGIAAAQNVGLQYAIDTGFEYIYYLDQDSISPSGIIEQLKSDLQMLESNGTVVAAIGPRPVNRQDNKEYRGSVNKGKYFAPGITRVSELMSSASLIRVENFRKAGLMESDLFIDAVDFEWCWRAKENFGGQCFISEKCRLSHQLGEGDKFFIVRKVRTPTPFRVYYQFRNYFWLLPRKYVPFYWKLSNGIKYFIKLFYYPIFLSPRSAYFKRIMSGINAGLFKKPSRKTGR